MCIRDSHFRDRRGCRPTGARASFFGDTWSDPGPPTQDWGRQRGGPCGLGLDGGRGHGAEGGGRSVSAAPRWRESRISWSLSLGVASLASAGSSRPTPSNGGRHALCWRRFVLRPARAVPGSDPRRHTLQRLHDTPRRRRRRRRLSARSCRLRFKVLCIPSCRRSSAPPCAL